MGWGSTQCGALMVGSLLLLFLPVWDQEVKVGAGCRCWLAWGSEGGSEADTGKPSLHTRCTSLVSATSFGTASHPPPSAHRPTHKSPSPVWLCGTQQSSRDSPNILSQASILFFIIHHWLWGDGNARSAPGYHSTQPPFRPEEAALGAQLPAPDMPPGFSCSPPNQTLNW